MSRKRSLQCTGIVITLVVLGWGAWDVHATRHLFYNIWSDAAIWLQPGWQANSSKQIPIVDGLSFFTLSLKQSSAEVQCRFVRFQQADFELLVLDNGSSRAAPRFRNLQEAVNRSKCLAGTNGGFFDIATFTPNGLMLATGRRTGEFQWDNWAEGVVVVRNQRLALEARDTFRFSESVTQLLQTGPWLVRDGKACRDFTRDTTAYQRTFIATDGRGTWLLGQVSGSTLGDLSRILSSRPFGEIMPVWDALNLDGGPSSGFYVRMADAESVYLEEATIVRNFLGIRSRSR